VGIGTSTGVSDPVSRLNVRAINNHTSGSDREDLVTLHQGISAWQVGRGAGIRWVGDVSRTMAGISSYVFGAEQTGLAFETGGSNSTNNLKPTTRMVIDNSGNVGIGEATPLDLLHLKTTNAATHIRLQRHESDTALVDGDEVGAIEFWANDSSSFSGASTLRAAIRAEVQNTSLGTRLEFWTGNSSATVGERMRIIADGNVGIGTGSPDLKLDVKHTTANQYIAKFQNTGNNNMIKIGNQAQGYLNIQGARVDNGNPYNISLQSDGGNVGIGTAVPVNFGTNSIGLTINGTGNYQNLTLQKSGATQFYIYTNGTAGTFLAQVGTQPMMFYVNDLERMRITATETTVNNAKLNHSFRVASDNGTNMLFVDGGNNRVYINNNTGPDLFYVHGNATSTAMGIRIGTNGYNAIEFDNATGSLVGRITINSGSTAYVTSSDYRLKENVADMTGATARLKQLKPKRFNWIADSTNTLIDGFLAHEVSSVVPEAIDGAKDAVHPAGHHEAGEIDPQGIDQSKLVPLLVKTIQELEARITALEA